MSQTSVVFSDGTYLKIIQIVLGLLLVTIGFYMVGPWYVVLPESAAFGVLAEISTIYTKVVSALQMFFGAATIWGTIKGKSLWQQIGLWGAVSMLALIVTTRLINIGFVPFIWTYQVAILLVAMALAYRARER